MTEPRLQMGAGALVSCWVGAALTGSYLVAGGLALWQELTDPLQEWGPVFVAVLLGTYVAVFAVPGALVLSLFHLLIRPVQRVPLTRDDQPEGWLTPS